LGELNFLLRWTIVSIVWPAAQPSLRWRQHDMPQTFRPSGHVTAATPASLAPQVTEQVAVWAQVTMQSWSHLMSHRDCSVQLTVLAEPRLILHADVALQVAVELAPALRSQFELAAHASVLSAPLFPLHSEVSWHSSVSAPFVLPLHLASVVQSSEQASSPHSVLQSWPAMQVHAESAHEHPTPVQVGAALSPPQPRAPRKTDIATQVASIRIRALLTGVHPYCMDGARSWSCKSMGLREVGGADLRG
jgi:hypothetical protein